jgi:hypothetical protein
MNLLRSGHLPVRELMYSEMFAYRHFYSRIKLSEQLIKTGFIE